MIRVWLVLGLLLLAPAAHAVDVSQLSDFEADPCVIALGERNTARHADAPDSELADACERAHGNVEVAWDFLTRTWQPRDVAASASSAAAPPLGMATAGLALLQMLLAYAVLGTPVWSVVVALQPRPRLPPRPRRLAVEASVSIAARIVLGSVLLALLRLPLATVLATLVVLASTAFLVRPAPRRSLGEQADSGPRPSAFAEIIAGVINDTAAAAAGLLTLSLFSRGNWRLLVLGVLLSLLMALPPVARGWQALRRTPVVFPVAATALAVGVGAVALSDPLARGFGSGALGYVVPLAFAAIVLWRAGLLDRLRPGRRQLSG